MEDSKFYAGIIGLGLICTAGGFYGEKKYNSEPIWKNAVSSHESVREYKAASKDTLERKSKYENIISQLDHDVKAKEGTISQILDDSKKVNLYFDLKSQYQTALQTERRLENDPDVIRVRNITTPLNKKETIYTILLLSGLCISATGGFFYATDKNWI